MIFEMSLIVCEYKDDNNSAIIKKYFNIILLIYFNIYFNENLIKKGIICIKLKISLVGFIKVEYLYIR